MNGRKTDFAKKTMSVKLGTFKPLIMSASGRFGKECTKLYTRLAELITVRRNEHYSTVLSWIKRKLRFENSVALCL